MSSVTRSRRLLRRGFLWARRLFVLGLIFVAVLVGLWWWYQPTLGKIALAVTNRAFPDFAAEAENVQRTVWDHLEIKKLRVRLRADASEVITLAHVDVFATWQELRAHRLREVRLEAPNVQVTDAVLAVLGAAGESGTASAPWTIERLHIKRGQLGLKIADAPPITVSLEAQLSGVSIGGAGEDTEQKIQLRDLRLQTRAPRVSKPRSSASPPSRANGSRCQTRRGSLPGSRRSRRWLQTGRLRVTGRGLGDIVPKLEGGQTRPIYALA